MKSATFEVTRTRVAFAVVPGVSIKVETRADAQQALERRFGVHNVRIFEKAGVKSVRVMFPSWPIPIEVARGRHSWQAMTTLALEYSFTVHRDHGWCIPEEGPSQPNYCALFRRRITAMHDASESGRERIAGVRNGANFEFVVGRRAVDPRRGTDQGVVVAILTLRGGAFCVVTTKRGLRSADPIVIERAHVVDEAAASYRKAQ